CSKERRAWDDSNWFDSW
nr:immunoglobulin heavy chain junction region [Macaca mulatta]